MCKKTIEYIMSLKHMKTTGSYGAIYTGSYKKHRNCIIKVQSLKTLAYYDKDEDTYYDHFHEKIDKSKALAIYYNSHIVDRLHNRKSITGDEFLHEVNIQTLMAKHHLAPKIYHSSSFICGNIELCMIIMKKMDTTLKSFISLTKDKGIIPNPKEKREVIKTITKIHQLGYKHGDLQANNIGININPSGQIKKCRILDWYFAQYLPPKLIESDWDLFKLRSGWV